MPNDFDPVQWKDLKSVVAFLMAELGTAELGSERTRNNTLKHHSLVEVYRIWA
jgi:hypothetical protein